MKCVCGYEGKFHRIDVSEGIFSMIDKVGRFGYMKSHYIRVLGCPKCHTLKFVEPKECIPEEDYIA